MLKMNGKIRLDFLATTAKARGQWKNIFKILKVTINLELGIQPN